MSGASLATAHRLLLQAVDALGEAAGLGSDAELMSVLTMCEGATRRLDRVTVDALAALERRGVFAERGYKSASAALSDLLGWERFEARRRVVVAEQVTPRGGLDGTPLPARLPATAKVFATGATSLRHVETIARVLGTDAAARLSPERRAGAEQQLAAKADVYTPSDLLAWGTKLVEALDQDGEEPDDRPPARVNELRLTRLPSGGGKLKGRFDDAAMFDAIATLVDAHAAPRTGADDRTPAQRQAEALADACGWVLDHADSTALPSTGGRRPQLNVLVGLADLEQRARAACLDFGGRLSPAALRMLACDAAVVPVVLGGAGQPLDVGRATRTIPEGLRRAVTARDRGCARCGRPPSWCEVHHVLPWEHGGETKLANLVMLCRVCHRLVHHAGWDVHLVSGPVEFVPPVWIDPQRRPRRRPPPITVPA